jgi:hypothetical protein
MNKPKDKDPSIASVLQNMYKRYRLDVKASELNIKKDWESIVGPLISKHTVQIELKSKTLYLKFDNPPLKNEMFLQRDLLLAKVNEHFGIVVAEKIFVG